MFIIHNKYNIVFIDNIVTEFNFFIHYEIV